MSATTAGSRTRSGKRKHRNVEATASGACRSCGKVNAVEARFCQACGRSLAGGSWFNAQTLTLLGAACITLVAIAALFASVIDTGGNTIVTTTSRTAPASDGQPPDLSTMTPREAADRLFNRVMMADEQGDAGEVEQFAPMAVAAYEQLESLDLDARFHVGLIHAAAGDTDAAETAVERLRAAVPGHLLASFLEHRLAEASGDQDKADRAIANFQASYDQEITIDRPEYQHHMRLIEQFRQQIGVAGDADG